jgi:hypothetical protein
VYRKASKIHVVKAPFLDISIHQPPNAVGLNRGWGAGLPGNLTKASSQRRTDRLQQRQDVTPVGMVRWPISLPKTQRIRTAARHCYDRWDWDMGTGTLRAFFAQQNELEVQKLQIYGSAFVQHMPTFTCLVSGRRGIPNMAIALCRLLSLVFALALFVTLWQWLPSRDPIAPIVDVGRRVVRAWCVRGECVVHSWLISTALPKNAK